MDNPQTLQLGHAERLHAADPLLPEPPALNADDLLTVRHGTAVALGSARFTAADPDSLGATWGALRQYSLKIQLSGDRADDRADDLVGALDALLTDWLSGIDAEPGDRDSAAVVHWPSRDVEALPAFAVHGFAPMTVTAIRPAGRTFPDGDRGVVIRPLGSDEADLALALHLPAVHYDARFGMVAQRPSTAARLREFYVSALRRDRPGVWVAERAGVPLGLLELSLPPHGDWIAGMVGPSPIAYLGCLSVVPDARGSGIGGALVAHAHRVADEAGVAITVLQHALPNPRSTPFWSAHGYRPLWTTWQRKPARP